MATVFDVYVQDKEIPLAFRVAAEYAGVQLAAHQGSDNAAIYESYPVLMSKDGPISGFDAIFRFLAAQCPDELSSEPGAADEDSISHWIIWCRDTLMPAITTADTSRLHDALTQIDQRTSMRAYLCGARITLADIAIAPTLCPVYPAIDKSRFAALARWYGACLAEPQFRAVAGGAGAAASGGAGDTTRAPVPLVTALTATRTALPVEMFHRYRSRISDLLAKGQEMLGQRTTICGWARTVRSQKTIQFVSLNDGSTFESIQVVADAGETSGYEAIAKAGGTGASFRVCGLVKASPGQGQAIEIHATSVTVLGPVTEPANYPLSKKKHGLEYLREIQHLRPRTNTIGAVARIRNACAYATHTFFQDRGFLYVHTPIVTGSDCEGAGEMFQVTTLLPADPKHDVPRTKDGSIDYKKDFFGKPAMLTVSGQLQVEAFAVSMSDVYTFGPTFRAELSHTSRHLAEFWMIEPEIAFATIEDDMALAEDYLKFCTKFVLDHCGKDLEFFEAQFEPGLRSRLENVVNSPFQRLTYTEAIDLLNRPEHLGAGKFEVTPYWGLDLGSEHERYITEQVYKKPVILINYPKEIKAFYMKLNPDGKTVAAMDVLVPKVGEIIGGSQREDDYDRLVARMAEMRVDEAPLRWYLELRKYGTVPHAGFGLGFERLVMYVTGLENIRDAIPYPRWPGNAAV